MFIDKCLFPTTPILILTFLISESKLSPSRVKQSSQISESSGLEQEQSVDKERMLLEELIEDVEQKAKVLLRYQAVVEISQASENLKNENIKLWADKLEVHPRTVTRLLERVESVS